VRLEADEPLRVPSTLSGDLDVRVVVDRPLLTHQGSLWLAPQSTPVVEEYGFVVFEYGCRVAEGSLCIAEADSHDSSPERAARNFARTLHST
jgi:hypothetical protein